MQHHLRFAGLAVALVLPCFFSMARGDESAKAKADDTPAQNKSEANAAQTKSATKPLEKIVLERVPGKSPEESLACIQVADGFRIELVAAEPHVMDPVAMAFDERGRLYVVEMRDYSERDKDRAGRVRLLTDTDGDGRFDDAKVFAEDLSWPTAVACYDGGVFVGAAPDIFYLKDTDGDGVADQKTVVFRGFSRTNVQGMLNSFHWGLDHRIWGSTSTTGGEISWVVRSIAAGPDDPYSAGLNLRPLDLQNRDFAIDPKTLAMVPTTGGGQHGMTFNHWGDRFVCHNSDHLQAIVFEERYLARNPYQSVVSARRSIAADGPQAEVFRISPVEAWREARTRLRVAGLAPGPIEGGGRAAGYFTSATGVTAYGGGLWSDDSEGLVYVADVGSNLVHRKRLLPDGVTYRGERIDKDSEFVRSTDIWFRPVQMAIGPEGALYIADMYRETIEHPGSLPAELKSQLDLNSGNDMGRIYRVVPKDYKHSTPKPLDNASTDDLVAALDDANQWRRMTALRLLYERDNKAAIPALRQQFTTAKRPEGRIAILYALNEVAGPTEKDLIAGLSDSHPQVRRHAIRLSEPLLDSSATVSRKLLSLVADDDPVVQFQLALSIGEAKKRNAGYELAQILVKSSANPDIVAAALSSMANCAGGVLHTLIANEAWFSSPDARPIVSVIVNQIVRQQRDEDLEQLINGVAIDGQQTHDKQAAVLLKALSRVPAEALARRDLTYIAKLQELRSSAAATLVADARKTLQSETATPDERVAAIENLGLDKFDNQQDILRALLSPREPAPVHAAVLSVCSGYSAPGVAKLVLSQWEQLAPAERSQAIDLLLRRKPWALALVKHLSAEAVPLSTLDPAQAAQLENYPSPKVSELARKLRGKNVSEDRRKVFDEYKKDTLAGGDPVQGKVVFEKNCATCHQVGGTGQTLGPNLAAMVSRGMESVLFNVLVPNGEVDPKFLEYVVVTVDGQVISGVIAGETATAVTLRSADNKTATILRVDIEELHNSRKSLMPEGFEKNIDKTAMANLLTYLKEAAVAEGGGK
jgi:putative membrane-bound dehydrogenase-like protein